MIDDLLERLEKATGYDDDLGYDIAEALGVTPSLTGPVNPGVGPVRIHRPYMRSLDAALALVEEKLPGRAADLLDEALSDMFVTGWRPGQPVTPQIARYVLKALLLALKSSSAEQVDGSGPGIPSNTAPSPSLEKG